MRATDQRYERDEHKHRLAQWMILRDARTGTVMRWTGLSEYRVRHLMKLYLPDHGAHRGNSPTAVTYFGRSSDLESESLAFLFVATELEVIPLEVQTNAPKSLPSLLRGERLRSAYELYCALVPWRRLTLEHAILLLIEFATRQNLSLKRCRSCNDFMIVERHAPQEQCPFCRAGTRMRLSSPHRNLLGFQQVQGGVGEHDEEVAPEGEAQGEDDGEVRSLQDAQIVDAQQQSQQAANFEGADDERG